MYVVLLTPSILDFSKNKLLQKFLLNPQNKQCPKIFTFQYFTPLNLIWWSVLIGKILLGRARTLRRVMLFVGCLVIERVRRQRYYTSRFEKPPKLSQCVNPLMKDWKGLGVRGV